MSDMKNMMPSLPTFLCRWIDNHNWSIKDEPSETVNLRNYISLRKISTFRTQSVFGNYQPRNSSSLWKLRKLSTFETQSAFRKYQPSELNQPSEISTFGTQSVFGNYQPRNSSSLRKLRKLSTFETQSAFRKYQPSELNQSSEISSLLEFLLLGFTSGQACYNGRKSLLTRKAQIRPNLENNKN
jgi:hypothetical protein